MSKGFFEQIIEDILSPKNPVPVKAKREKIDNTKLLADTGLRILHIRKNSQDFPDNTSVRDMTIAFREGSSTLEIATAVVHPEDCFIRKMGTKLAVEAFLAGKVTRVPKVLDYTHTYGDDRLATASAIRSLCLMFGRI